MTNINDMTPSEYRFVEHLDENLMYVASDGDWSFSYEVLESLDQNSTMASLSDEEREFFASGSKKCLIKVSPQFFHIIHDTLGLVVSELERTPGVEFIFHMNSKHSVSSEILNIVKFIQSSLEARGVRSIFVTLPTRERVAARNFYYTVDRSPTMYSIGLIVKFLRDSLSLPDVKPWRKVYLSRGKAPDNSPGLRAKLADRVPRYINFVDDIRIDDEKKLEEFLQQKGFEIVYPEDFTSFKDQITFMWETRVIASVTSAGLLNSLFMQDGQTMLEIQVPLVSVGPGGSVFQSLHNFYQPISYVLKHDYISIPAMRSADLVLSRASNRPYLKELLSS